ncbi:MAG TPA: hypothetical protein DGT21_25025 [Armatimonadetes bacterium]|jgi:hypothetical protein|nr:hypothetical protein [Armatimonadota bacterium]
MRSRLVTFLLACLCACIDVGLCTPCSAGELIITGTVVTPDGKPAAGATVFSRWFFINPPGSFAQAVDEVLSDETGAFTLRLEAEGEPFAQHDLGVGAILDGYGLGWTLVPITQTKGITISVREAATATGTVVDGDGKPVAGVQVSVSSVMGSARGSALDTSRLRATTDEAGRFEIRGLPRGDTIALLTSAEGYQAAHTERKPAEQLVDEIITLRRATSISGRVTRDGKPVEGIAVLALQVPIGGYTSVGSSDAEGVYTVRGLLPGTYAVRIHWPASAKAVGDRTAVAHPSVKCDIDAPATGIDFELIEGGLVTGTIRNARTNEPLPAASVVAYASRGGFPFGGSWQVAASADGTYSLRLPAGTYSLQGQANGYQQAGQDPSVHDVTVEGGRTLKGPDIELKPIPRIAGTVVDTDGKPVVGGAVRTVQYDGRETVTDAEGRFDLEVGYFALPTEICVVDTERGLVGRLSFTEDTTDARIVIEPGGVATGQVVDPDGKGLGGLSVTASYVAPIEREHMPHAQVRLPATPTDAEGHFRLACLPYGVELTIYVDGEDGRFISERKWAASVELPPRFQLDLGPTVLDRAGQTLAGRVMDAERELIPGCTVVDLGTRRTVKTDAAGRFEFTELPLLAYQGAVDQPYRPCLLAIHPEEPLFCGANDVDPAWGYELDMILEPPGKVRGRIVDADGKPTSGVMINLMAHGVGFIQWPDAVAEYANIIAIGSEMQSREDGTWEFEGLVPGVQYAVYAMGGADQPTRFYEQFMPIPGDTVDLGDLGGKGVQ